jgi:hypothetical protein
MAKTFNACLAVFRLQPNLVSPQHQQFSQSGNTFVGISLSLPLYWIFESQPYQRFTNHF